VVRVSAGKAFAVKEDGHPVSTLHLFTPRGDLLQPKHHAALGVLPTEVVGSWGSGDARTRKSATAQALWLRVNSLLASVRPSVDVAGTRYRIAVGRGLERQRDLMKRPLAPEGRLTG